MPPRLISIATHGVPGLPDVDIGLRPVTALIGPHGSGKSRVLTAISWLLSGRPELAGPTSASDGPFVSAEIESRAGRHLVTRGRGQAPTVELPAAEFFIARDRLPPEPTATLPAGVRGGATGKALAEAMDERIRSGRSGEVVLIEEPELMLTPQSQRHLYRLLRAYAERNQVIYSTRAPALLDAAHHQDIVRLDLTRVGLAIRNAPQALLTDAQRLRLAAEFDHERSEMFFATAVVLVEGQTERLSMPWIFRSLGYDPDALGISITEVGGKGNLIFHSRVLAGLRIPHLIVFDADQGDPAQESNAAIREAAGDTPVFMLDPDFEAVAGIQSGTDKVLRAWRRFHSVSPDKIPDLLRSIVDETVRLALTQPRT